MLDSLRSRLALSNLLITLLGLVVVVVVFIQLLAQRSTDLKKHDLAQQSRAVAAQIDTLYRHGGKPADLQQLIDSASFLLHERVIVVSPPDRKGSYTIRVDSARRTPFVTGAWHPLDRKALRDQDSAQASLRNGNLILFQAPIRGTTGRNGGAVLLVARVTDVLPSASSLIPIMLVAAGTALIVWLLIGFYFTTSVSRPLLRITQATRRMAAGDYGVRVPVQGPREISTLAASFNGMAQQVSQANQVLRDFVANVSHDLRTPLTIISGFSQALVDGTSPADEVESTGSIINEEARRMQHLVDDLLQLTRLESGLFTLDRQPTEALPFVQSVITSALRARDSAETPRILNQVPAQLPLMDVDAGQLERALRNLVDNALQYTPPEGSVTVGARRAGRGWIEISVADTGSGIATEQLPRIFERFYRSDKGRERQHGHSGLGLAIVREIVEAHGGTVRAESEPGHGSTFSLTVPEARDGRPEPVRSTATESVQEIAPW